MSSKTSHVQTTLYEVIQRDFGKGQIFTVDSFETDFTRAQMNNAFNNLHKKGLLNRGPVKGQYFISLKGATPPANPAQTIYDLLDFMAKAEPALKRAAKILEAVDNA